MLKLGIIGYGVRTSYVWQGTMRPIGGVELAAIADPKWEKIKKEKGDELPNCRYYATAEEMLENEKLDGVMIGTRDDLHTRYALLVAKYNIPLFLEKPVAITDEQLADLETIVEQMNDKTVVSFPLRMSKIVVKIKEMIDSGLIGKVSQVQAYNNVYYARCYYHNWYRNDSFTGGLYMTKATHDLNYIDFILGGQGPETIASMESKVIFKGDKPAGLKCKDCDDKECLENPVNLSEADKNLYWNDSVGCSFAVDTGNHDSATIMMMYENGMHVVYTQNFVARHAAGKRGARFIGFKGTIEFDFNTETITYIDHFSEKVENIKVSEAGAHSGGDYLLAKNFIDVMAGTDNSIASLSEGILSAKMCLRARTSAQTHTFVKVK